MDEADKLRRQAKRAMRLAEELSDQYSTQALKTLPRHSWSKRRVLNRERRQFYLSSNRSSNSRENPRKKKIAHLRSRGKRTMKRAQVGCSVSVFENSTDPLRQPRGNRGSGLPNARRGQQPGCELSHDAPIAGCRSVWLRDWTTRFGGMGRAIIGDICDRCRSRRGGTPSHENCGSSKVTSVKVPFQEPDLIRRSLFVLLRADD